MKYILNNYYILRHDLKKTLILGGYNNRTVNGTSKKRPWTSIIHPAYAMMLSFFSTPKSLKQAQVEIARFFNIPEEKIATFLKQITGERHAVAIDYEGIKNSFPEDILIPEQEEFFPRVNYTVRDFAFNTLDLHSRRVVNGPLTLVWMPNSNCYTNCAYCYADRSRNCTFNQSKVEDFLKDARKSGVLEIVLTGGDIFMNPTWSNILSSLAKYKYDIGFVSTKKPLNLKEIERFKEFNLHLQLSLDTTNPEVAKNLLNVEPDYIEKMKASIQKIDAIGIKYHIATVLTNLNDSIAELERLKQFIISLPNLEFWNIRVGFASLYSRESFEKIKSSNESINKVRSWVEILKQAYPGKIGWADAEDDRYKKSFEGSRAFPGALCSANMTNLMVLPSGDVTICEQLYWNPQFILGNIHTSSLRNLWNSPKAQSINHITREMISKQSACKSCTIFEECFSYGNRCYANIIKAYGSAHVDFPDPRCSKSPDFKNNITHG